ncbi:MAG: long-chain acyl-CoA synthetase [Frankiaceae bacterium]|nr:long-chain acyl-CoA synthetase [Frankiaceae bacterium]
MAVCLATEPTGLSLQRLGELAEQRNGADSRLVFEGRTWTGSELAARARRVSTGFREIGLSAGERVVVCMANCPEVGISYSAIWRAGGVTTPVVFLLSEDELRHVFSDSEAACVITTPEFLPKVAAAARDVPTVRGLVVVGDAPTSTGSVDAGRPVIPFAELEDSDESDLTDTDPTELAALLYTGGTTGRSKGVMLSHDAMSTSAWAATANSFESGVRRSLLPLPLSHAYGLLITTMGLHAPEPGTTVLQRWFTPGDWLTLAAQHQIQTGAVVPSMLQLLLQQPIEDHDLSHLRRLSSGGAPLSQEVAAAFRARVPQVEIAEGYGCTETAALVASNPLGAVRPGSVGVAVPGVEIRIEPRTDGNGVDGNGDDGAEEGASAPAGVDGEICVRGKMLMQGYWRSPEETAKTLRGGWLHTGDIGHLDADGYLYVVDRIKDLIIRGGFNVYPRDVEDMLLGHRDVVAAAVVGRPDPTYGEEVIGFVQLKQGAGATPLELVQFAKEHLAATKYPREIHVVDQVPLTSVGKTDRKALRSRIVAAP